MSVPWLKSIKDDINYFFMYDVGITHNISSSDVIDYKYFSRGRQ